MTIQTNVFLLTTCLCCLGAQAAMAAAKPGERVTKSGLSQAVHMSHPDGRQIAAARASVVIPAHIAPQGLGLALSTSLRVTPAPATSPAPAAYVPFPNQAFARPRDNPYLPQPAAPRPVFNPKEAPRPDVGSLLGSLGLSIPLLPDSGQSILPSIQKVYPTGEKPLVVVSFKCPTELLGVTPPTIKLLHEAVNLGMEGINRTGLLSFNLQQVCQ